MKSLWLGGLLLLTSVRGAGSIAYGKVVNDRRVAPQTALVHTISRFRIGRSLRRRNDYCTGTLISRQVAITAGHCVRDRDRFCCLGMNVFSVKRVQVHFLDMHRVVVYRHVEYYKEGQDLAVLFLNKPIGVCGKRELENRVGPKSHRTPKLPVHVAIARLPITRHFRPAVNDEQLRSADCYMYGFETNGLDYKLRYMRVFLNVTKESSLFYMKLPTHQKGDSGAPVVCTIGDEDYTIAISSKISSSKSTAERQLCDMRDDTGNYIWVEGAKFYDIRQAVRLIREFLIVSDQLDVFREDYRQCFDVEI